MLAVRLIPLSCCVLAAALSLTACQQPQQRGTADIEEQLRREPSSAGAATCTTLPADWLSNMPTHQRLIEPDDCSVLSSTPLFSWAEARDRLSSATYGLSVRRAGGSIVYSLSGIAEPRLRITQQLAAGDYEWAVNYINTKGALVTTSWRRFTIAAVAARATVSALSATASTETTAALTMSEMPDGATIATQVIARARPRMLASGASYSSLRSTALLAENLPALALVRGRANWALTQAIPANPDGSGSTVGTANLAQVQATRNLVQTTRGERFNIENLALVGRLDGNATMLAQAKARVLNLAGWNPTGQTSETNSDQSNREIYLVLAEGLDLFWNDFTAAERTRIVTALRTRVLQTTASLQLLNKEPFDSHGQTNLRYVTQTLMLVIGAADFPEAPSMLARYWDLSLYNLEIWGADGSFGNGIAYAWYNFTGTVPYAAAVRVISGVNLYQLATFKRAGEQLMAFTAPAWLQPSAFGDEMETRDLYNVYSPAYMRMHARQSRDPRDSWYLQARAANMTKPDDASVWDLLLLGADARALPAPVAPTANDWFSTDTGLAAMHTDIRRSDRTSVFFRSSRFGAYNHSHADQNSVAYVSRGLPLLINAGYYPYYNSPHHKSTRATRYANSLTYDGGFGQSESSAGAAKPTDPFHSMDSSGSLILAKTQGTYAAVTGDATLAYRGVHPTYGTWVPALTNAVRSVVVDKANGVTLVYDWATSATARQWELNFHSPNAFVADAANVRAVNGAASVCLDRYGPTTSFSQTTAWDVAPETAQPAQSHGRFTVLARTAEFAHLTVLRDSCRNVPVQVQRAGTQVVVSVAGGKAVQFDKRLVALPQ